MSYLPPPRRAVAIRRLIGSVLLAVALTVSPAAAEPPSDRTWLNREIDAAAQRLELVTAEYHAVRDDLRITRAQIEVLARQIGPLQRAMDAHRDHIGALAAGQYRGAGGSALTALLGAASAEQFADRLLAVEQLTRDRQRAIARLAATRQRYEAARHTLAVLTAQQRTQEARLAIRQRQMATELARLRSLRQRTRP